jgi:hypothetical protein
VPESAVTPQSEPNAAIATPAMTQYFAAKRAHPDCLLFYRMGDFYELFFEDALKAAPILDIALTKRGQHSGQDIPMCGVPAHALDGYLAKAIRRGCKVAICEQMENPEEARKRGPKSVVRREVIRIVTPGTITEETLLDAASHNYLAALAEALARQVVVAHGEQVERHERRGRLGRQPVDARLGRVDPLLQRAEVQGRAAGHHDLAVHDAALGQLGPDGRDDLGKVPGERALVARAQLDLVAVAEDDAAKAVPLGLVEHPAGELRRVRDVGDRLGQHRLHRRHDGKAHPRSLAQPRRTR